MESSRSIACTVEILTHNSGATLRRALESVREFADILIIDGNSKDDTLDIAHAVGARIIRQDPLHLDADGRIKDFSAIRNQGLDSATQPWFFFLDSDEYCSPELVEAIRGIVTNEREGAYWVTRKYVVDGRAIECAASYPNRSLRLFARPSAGRFAKPVHETVRLVEGTSVGFLSQPLFVPRDVDTARDRAKEQYYLAIEVQRLLQSPDPYFRIFFRAVRFNLRAIFSYAARLLIRRPFCKGASMPWRDEIGIFRYHMNVLFELWRRRGEAEGLRGTGGKDRTRR